ncbi:MAG: NAD(P)-dependent oxidoreductase [Erysipelotrichaceae bacterium]|nr:NAD(P)-dependent oxidoreductase [Erysipelotrichaceae bacterium]
MNIAFIGTGVMGASMVRNLLKKNHSVTVYNRTPEKALALVKDGAVFAGTIQEAVKDAEVVFTIVGYPKDVEEVYAQIFKYASPGTIAVDMTTSKPSLAAVLHEKGKAFGISVMDAPVTGGDTGAREGTLTIMAAGDKDSYDTVLPLLEAMGTKIFYMGSAGNGQHTKMANQIALAGTLVSDMESMVYAARVGMDPAVIQSVLKGGFSGSVQMSNTVPRVLNGDYEPGFYIKHFIKDMRIALEESKKNDYIPVVLSAVCGMYEELAAKGFENLGTQAIIKYYEKQ